MSSLLVILFGPPVRSDRDWCRLGWWWCIQLSGGANLQFGSYSCGIGGFHIYNYTCSQLLPVMLGTPLSFNFSMISNSYAGAMDGSSGETSYSDIKLRFFESDGVTAVDVVDPLSTPESPTWCWLLLCSPSLFFSSNRAPRLRAELKRLV